MQDKQRPENISKTDELKVHLEEYKYILTHVIERVKIRHTLFNYTIVLIAAALAGAINIYDNPDLHYLFLIVPLPFIFILGLLLENDMIIATIMSYFYNILRPKIAEASECSIDTIMRLEYYLHITRDTISYKILAGSRYLIILLPAISFVILYFYLNYFCYHNFLHILILVAYTIIFTLLILVIIKRTTNPPEIPNEIKSFTN